MLFVGVYALYGQKMSFAKSTIDVGTIMWKSPIVVDFDFTNKGTIPLIINDIDSGCGCINVEWPKGFVDKGDKAKISVTFDALLLGHFDRVIKVYSNENNSPKVIRLKGIVSAEGNDDLLRKYPYSVGSILLSTDDIEFPDVHKGDSVSVSFNIYNNGSEVYMPQLMHLPPYVMAEYYPVMLGRGKSGTINLKLSTVDMDNFGINQSKIYLARFSGDRVSEENEISLTSILLPDINSVEDSLLGPKLHVSTNTIDFGKLGRKSRLTKTVVFTNNGSALLNIESVAVFNQALNVSIPKRALQPGESMKIKVSLHSKYLNKSNIQPRVLIITNDSQNQKVVLSVKFDK